MSVPRGQLPPGKKNAHVLRDLGGAAHAGRKEGAVGESIGTGQNMLMDANDMGAEVTPMLTGERRREQLPYYHFPWEAVPCDTLVSQTGFAVIARPWAHWIPPV